MKKFLYLSTYFLLLFTALQVQANVITVKGHIKLTNGSPAVNTQVQIAVYVGTSAASCSEQFVVTNSQGFYSKEFTCVGDIRRSRISVKNCNGQVLVQERDVPASKIIEANFTLCVAAPPKCSASFKADPIPATAANAAFTVRFNSSESAASDGDHITSRTWNFQDGTPPVTGKVELIHTFPKAGTYEVCLLIKTALGCENKVCRQIVIPPVKNTACVPKFTFEPVPATSTLPAFSIKFNSNISEVGSGDNITSRTWYFQDGTPPITGKVDLIHTFPKAGTYEVCLLIKTALGCENKVCRQIVIPPVKNTACVPKFTFEPVPATSTLPPFSIKFNSNISEVSNGDNIIHRTWNFQDGTPLVTGKVELIHTFPKAGTYEVCLLIKTALGCESKVCRQIVIPPVKNTACVPKFTAEPVPATTTLPPFSIKFNSNISEVGNGDNIIHRTWNFQDGTPPVTDKVDLIHTFPKAGTYEVCLLIQTALGCENKVCRQIVIPPVKNTACVPKFTSEPVPATSTLPPFSIKFNSNISEVSSGDHIIHRTWYFKDGTPPVTDKVDLIHTFPKAGTYEVCLLIETAKGCENKICKQIVVPPVTNVACTARFAFEKLGPRKFRFNGNMNVVAANDNIIERKWDFKDGTTSTDVSPVHEFVKAGNYEVCLKIRTRNGCESHFCAVVKVEDNSTSADPMIKIVSLYPLPVNDNLKAVIFSKNTNVVATISIVNIYGIIQSTRQITLTAGFNPVAIPVNALLKGPYFIKVMTQYGTVSNSFYKL